jgi:serine/threonine protein phosphatase 1
MKRTLVMGDIHGAHKAMKQGLERSRFDPACDTLIQLGDVTDGYPQVYECVEALIKIPHLVALKGNHDDWFDQFCKTDFHPYFWTHGGKGTLVSYLGQVGKIRAFRASGSGYKTSLVLVDIPETHKSFFDQQLLYYIDQQNRFFVHAGFNRHLPLNKQRKEDFYWDRTLWAEALHIHTHQRVAEGDETFFTATDFSEIYVGHTPTTKWGTDQPVRALNVLNLDTGAGHSGRLTIMDVDTKQFWQSDPLPKLYDQNFRDEVPKSNGFL